MTAPDRSIEDAALIAFVREQRDIGWADDYPQWDALLSRLEGRGSGTEQALRAALEPFARFAEKWDAKPLSGMHDDVYGIHGGDDGLGGDGASLRLSDCRKARCALASSPASHCG